MTVAIIYTRFSPRPNAEECDSCDKQEERCWAYCAGKGYEVLAVRPDEEISGGVLDRPGLSDAIQDLEEAYLRGNDAVLVVDTMDRLARDMLITLTIRHEVERAGGRIEYANGTTPSETPEGKLFGNILAAFAAYERDRVRYATSRGMKRRQANGEWFGKPPVGFQYNPDTKRLMAHPTELAAKARVIQLGLGPLENAGCFRLSSEKIAALVTEEFGCFRGKPWSPRTVRGIIAKAQREEE